MKDDFSHKLDTLLTAMQQAPQIYQASKFWQELGEQGAYQLHQTGFQNFKRTVNMRYFNWNMLGILAHQILPITLHWVRNPTTNIFKAKFPAYKKQIQGVYGFNILSSWLYKTYVAMFWEYCKAICKADVALSLEEPSIGNPFVILYQGQRVSQDLSNSVLEFHTAFACTQLQNRSSLSIAELGAGYGRLAYVFLKTIPGATYTVIDIPPALLVAQEYLSEVFGTDRIFRARPFESYDEIKSEFESCRIRFLMSHQISLLPQDSINLFLNISSLHEMTFDQISNYLAEIDRVTSGLFYTKQWRKSRAYSNRMIVKENEYPIPVKWHQVFHRRHAVQKMFFEALYQV